MAPPQTPAYSNPQNYWIEVGGLNSEALFNPPATLPCSSSSGPTFDCKIAYNECMRATAVDKLMKEQTLAHLGYYAAVRFTPHKCVWIHPLCQGLISLWADKLPLEGIEPWTLVDQIGVALASSYPNLIVGDRP